MAAAESRAGALRTELAEATDELTSQMGGRFALAQLKPLSPEQMCWSILEVTGVYDRYRKVEEAALAKAKPLTGPAAADKAVLHAPRDRGRAAHVRQVERKLSPHSSGSMARPPDSRRTTSSPPRTRPCSPPTADR